jgi:photosystem II stability/assembly factor-like uncharacterized protein
LLLQNPDKYGFWDAIDFWDRQRGFIFGDPVNGRFQIWLTCDGGQYWQLSPAQGMPLNVVQWGNNRLYGAGPKGRLVKWDGK